MASSESAAAQPQQDEREEATVHNGSFTSYSIQISDGSIWSLQVKKRGQMIFYTEIKPFE
jgi:hypothetical protein